jgi:integrase
MKQPKPYYKRTHHAWYANIGPNKRPVKLATEEEGEQAAWDKYHAQMANRQPIKGDTTVAELLDRYLDHCKLDLADSTYRARRRTLESFARHAGSLRISALKPHHLTGWINDCHRLVAGTTKETSPTYRHNLIRTAKTALKWAEDEGHIDRSPVRKVKLPTPRSRDVYLTPEQWDKLYNKVAKAPDGGCLLDFITVLHDTGCRPQEARRAEARHFDREGRCWVFPAEESKGKRDPRVVRLTDRAFEICQRLVLKNPTGPMFRNRKGNPWTRYSLHCRFYRLAEKLGFHVCSYSIRHTFATDAIIRGVDLVSIAMLMGHTDLKMLSRVYQHVQKRSDHLQAALRKAVGQ